MKQFFLILGCLAFHAAAQAQSAQMATPLPFPPAKTVETIVCIRHGEKTSQELGQLDIQGLNRSLALPKVLLSKYGRPGFIFAPNPAETVAHDICYVRPLATIEPTAIVCGLPVDTQLGFRDIQALESELRKPLYQNAVVFVAWEHVMLEEFVRALVAHLGGDRTKVPVWPRDDFDSIYLVKITTVGRESSVEFTLDHEGLNNLSATFPGPPVPDAMPQAAAR